LPAATNKNGSYKDASTATHSTGTSGGTGAAGAGHDAQEKPAVHRGTLVLELLSRRRVWCEILGAMSQAEATKDVQEQQKQQHIALAWP
jgi:hypothetical protein